MTPVMSRNARNDKQQGVGAINETASFCHNNLLITYLTYTLVSRGSTGGAVVRALASHQCGPGSIPGPGVICGLSLLLVVSLLRNVFSA